MSIRLITPGSKVYHLQAHGRQTRCGRPRLDIMREARSNDLIGLRICRQCRANFLAWYRVEIADLEQEWREDVEQ